MDTNRFDQIGRFMTRAHTRRGAAGLGLVGALAALGARNAAGKKKKKNKDGRCALIRCKQCHRCKNGKCKPAFNGQSCGIDGTCADGECIV